jgi:hypothetical protein
MTGGGATVGKGKAAGTAATTQHRLAVRANGVAWQLLVWRLGQVTPAGVWCARRGGGGVLNGGVRLVVALCHIAIRLTAHMRRQ